MVIITFIFAAIYLALGIVFYALANFSTLTALIPPLVVAVLFTAIAAVSLKQSLRMHAMHIAALLSLILFIAFVGSYANAFDYLTAAEGYQSIERPLAYVEKTLISLISLAFFVATLISFIKARVLRKKEA